MNTNNTSAEFTPNAQHVSPIKEDERVHIAELRFEQVTQYQNLTLGLIGVEDSRCAIGVTCIWAGQMVVKLEISNNLGNTEEIKLVRKRESETVQVFGYTFRLLGIDPHPKKGQVIQSSEQVVQLEIVNLDND